ncbi:hypothetical protein ACFVAJ_17705 [Agromyces sp. NPDC057679]|uniref:hypothetical protein n=1 Tax=Agromyces sp. NPDC057679 TaxID=3346207 RepID=UPI00366ADA6E
MHDQKTPAQVLADLLESTRALNRQVRSIPDAAEVSWMLPALAETQQQLGVAMLYIADWYEQHGMSAAAAEVVAAAGQMSLSSSSLTKGSRSAARPAVRGRHVLPEVTSSAA